jgi:hypothetical protein
LANFYLPHPDFLRIFLPPHPQFSEVFLPTLPPYRGFTSLRLFWVGKGKEKITADLRGWWVGIDKEGDEIVYPRKTAD